MKFLKKLFKKEKLVKQDPDFGEIKSFKIKGENVWWQAKGKFFEKEIDIHFNGNRNGIFPSQKRIVLSALNNQSKIKAESIKALKEEFDNADEKFISLNEHFVLEAISVNGSELELSFLEQNIFYYFNVHFKNNKQVGVSIDS